VYFVTYEYTGDVNIGILANDLNCVVPLQACERYFFNTRLLPDNMLEFIRQGDMAFARAAEIWQKIQSMRHCPYLLPLPKVRLKAPIPRPAKNIFCLGKNYREHAREFDPKGDIPQYPIFFTKAANCVIGPEDAIDSHPTVTKELDYEAELAVVIGKKGKFIPKEQAMDYVFGYMIMNDVTARDLQRRHGQWFRGKSLDTSAPMGPYLVHKSSVPDPGNLNIITRVNGEIRQQANTGQMIFDIPTIIATLSDGLTLEPGDIIATGTPAGVGAAFDPPRFLRSGDSIEMEISYLGSLKNKVI